MSLSLISDFSFKSLLKDTSVLLLYTSSIIYIYFERALKTNKTIYLRHLCKDATSVLKDLIITTFLLFYEEIVSAFSVALMTVKRILVRCEVF